MKPLATIEAFDLFLAGAGLSLEAVVIGGAALALLGVVTRQTKDYDILHPLLPDEVAHAARKFAAVVRSGGTSLDNDLRDDWLNNGPSSLCRQLPVDWEARLVNVFLGKAITLFSLGRPDLLKAKLFALCDRFTDLEDCLALSPTAEELKEASPWVAYQDANPDWPAHVEATLAELARRLSHVV
jgi:hypothetical protein